MKPNTDILATLSTLRDCLVESHQDELDNHHHGDDSQCSYCKAIEEADAILASSSSPDDDDGNDAPAHHMRGQFRMPLCTHVINRKMLHRATNWDALGGRIASASGIKIEEVPQSLMVRLHNREDVFFALRSELPSVCWLKAYESLLDAGLLIHNSEDNSAGEVVRQSCDSTECPQEMLVAQRMAAHAVRRDIVECIAEAIESTYEFASGTFDAIDAIMKSKDVLQTLSVVLPHCEWFECYVEMQVRGILVPSKS